MIPSFITSLQKGITVLHALQGEAVRNIEEAILRTCREMIDRDGIHAISVRKLAEASGCSLRSLYNKFENIGAVYRRLVDIFTDDVATFVTGRIDKPVETDDELYAVHESFLLYFLSHPNRFYFMYLFKHEGLDTEPRLFDTGEFQKKIQQSFEYLSDDETPDRRDVGRLQRDIVYGIFGLLVLHFTGNFGMPSDHVLDEFRRFFVAQMSAFRCSEE
jgi:AcrR family transcriptional regulator